MHPSRRDFINQSIGTIAAMATYGTQRSSVAGDADQLEQIPIVDTHQHLWNLKQFKLPWLSAAPDVLKRSYGLQDYIEATAGLNVVRAVYMEVDVDPEQQTAEAEYL